ncbi:MAG: amino acid racemase [Pseudomonadota bacterium]
MTQNSQTKPIGVLGGMGPEATVLLQQKLIAATPAQDDADHIPLLIDMNPQVPSRIAHLIEGTGEDPGPTLTAMAQRLETAGAGALAMPCNTAHSYASAIVGAVAIPLLNMIDLAADHALATLGKGGRVGLLASPAVRRTQLFETALQARGLTPLWPQADAPLLTAIRAIKAQGPCQQARDILSSASEDLLANGAGLQFVACSEFSMIARSTAPGARVVDTLDLLVTAMVQFQPAGPTPTPA